MTGNRNASRRTKTKTYFSHHGIRLVFAPGHLDFGSAVLPWMVLDFKSCCQWSGARGAKGSIPAAAESKKLRFTATRPWLKETGRANMARWSEVAASYHCAAKWTHPLIIDTLALSQHFIVSRVSSGMTQSTWQREIKDGAVCDSHCDTAINEPLWR